VTTPLVPIRPIIIDTREQAPWCFPPSMQTIRRGLGFGDYSLDGLDSVVAIERKSIPDLLGCVGTSRERFTRHLFGLADLPFAHVVVEGSMATVASEVENTSLNLSSVMGTIVSWAAATGVHFWFPDDRRFATALALRILTISERKFDGYVAQQKVGNDKRVPLHLVGEEMLLP